MFPSQISPLATSLLLLGGPTIPCLYVISVWSIYLASRELQWNDIVKPALARIGVLVTALSVRWGLEAAAEEDRRKTMVVLPLALMFIMASVFLCVQTRRKQVVGISRDKIPYYGPTHLEGQLILITGANSGIGKETAAQMARMGAKVVLMCRSEERARAAIKDILEDNTGDIAASQLIFQALDLGDFASIRQAVGEMREKLGKDITVNTLINNAGLMMSTQTTSKDGYEMMMQANHLGHFLLARLLIREKMLLSDARIINVTSSTYALTSPSFDFDDMFCVNGSRHYSLFSQYSMSKLANILFTKELDRRHPQFTTLAAHPGIVRTNVTSNLSLVMRLLNQAFALVVASTQKTPEQGAYTSVFCAAAPKEKLPPSGSYMSNCAPYPTNEAASSQPDAKRLWEVSERLVKW